MLEINNLHVEVENKEILSGIDLKVKAGEMHAIMGLNGSGKSTLSNAITGRENYNVTKGDIIFKDESILEMEPNERALAGIFMSFQYPTVIPGVNNTYFLRAAVNAKKKYKGEKEYDAATFLKFVKSKLKERMKDYGVEGFSVHPGGIITPLQRHLEKEEMIALGWMDKDGSPSELAKNFFKSPSQGASTTLWCATSNDLNGLGGVFCEDCDIAKRKSEVDESLQRYFGVADWAVDTDEALKLWELSEKIITS